MPTYDHAYRDRQEHPEVFYRPHPPRTVKEFRAWVKEVDRSITCREEVEIHCPHCADTVITKVPVVNQYGQTAHSYVLTAGRHEGLDLSEEVIEFLKLPVRSSTPTVMEACEKLNQLVQDPSPASVLQRLGHVDARDVIPHEYQYLLSLLNAAFLPGKTKFKFSFCGAPPDRLGSCGTYRGYAHVELHTWNCDAPPACGFLNSRAMSRLSTLLHEAVHAFIQAYACLECPTYHENIGNARGHGIVWQRIANWVEHAALETLGLSLGLGRFHALQHNWSDATSWPTPEEVKYWSLEDD